MRGQILDREAQEALLATAVQSRLPIELSVQRATDEIRFASHFVPSKAAEAQQALRIQRPFAEISDALLVPGTRLRLTFVHQRKAYWFLATLLGPLPNSQESLLVEYPQAVVQDLREDRAFYRLSRWTRSPIPITFWTIPDPKERKTFSGGARWNGQIDNISGGGVGIRIDAAKTSGVSLNQAVGVFWSFRPDDPPYVMRGIVRSKDVTEDGRVARVGIQFVESFNKTEHQTNLNRLLRYITEQERLLIKKRSS